MSRHDMSTDYRNAKPLTEPVLLILATLASGPQHGYLLMREIERLSDGRVSLSTGTMYGALRRLLDAGWIAAVDLDDTSRDKQGYRLTADGRRRLAAEHERLEQLARLARAHLRQREA
jgi:PadR family transcriptional regulator, regulatory protein PadR